MLKHSHSLLYFSESFSSLIIYIAADLNGEEVIKALQSARRVYKEEPKKETTESDMQNCFGFDVSFFLSYLYD